MAEDLPYLKQVSRVKHRILRYYLPPWANIIGSAHRRLAYIDCFAGGGAYVDENGEQLPGSPLLAMRLAKDYVRRYPNRSLILGFVEGNPRTAQRLKDLLTGEDASPPHVDYFVREADAHHFVEELTSEIRGRGPGQRIIPTFFFIDPYGYPLSIPVIRNLLSVGQTEILINLMWYQILRDLPNPNARGTIDRLFGHTEWNHQEFMHFDGARRERAFVDYFMTQVGAGYSLRFPVRFSPEDRVQGGERRTKFYLLHLSNHPKAALLMKEVMWASSDDIAELQFGARGQEKQLRLFVPSLEELHRDLLTEFRNIAVTFDDVRLRTLDWTFREKDYRTVIKGLESERIVQVMRVESKKSGLKGRDIIRFP